MTGPRRTNPARIVLISSLVFAAILVAVWVLLRKPAPPVARPASAPATPTAVASASASAPTATPTPAAESTGLMGPVEVHLETPLPDSPLPEDAPSEMAIERFTGFVVDAGTYKPIGGARVFQYVFSQNDLKLDGDYPKLLETVLADREGKFAFQQVSLSVGQTLGWRCEATGYATIILLFPEGEGLGDKARSSFLMPPGGTISGTVVDTENQPIAGALVGDICWRTAGLENEGARAPMSSAYTYTDPTGAYTLNGLNAKIPHRLPARMAGYLPGLSLLSDVGATDVVITLKGSEATLLGRVLEADGEPAAGALIEATLTSRQLPEGENPVRTETADESGKFTFADLYAGDYTVRATKPLVDVFGEGGFAEKTVTLVKKQQGEVELRLPARAHVSGRFYDAATQKGVEGVRLQTLTPDVVQREQEFQVVSDADGLVAFDVAVADVRGMDSVLITVTMPAGWFPSNDQPDRGATMHPARSELELSGIKPGSEHTFSTALEQGVSINGWVFEPDGTTPVADQPVFIEAEPFSAIVQTDAAGAFATSVPADRSIKVEASSGNGIANGIYEGKALKDIVLILKLYGKVSGTVKNEKGEGISGRAMSITRRGLRESYKLGLRFDEIASTDIGGYYEIANVAPGTLSVVLTLGAASEFEQPKPIEITLEPAQDKQNVNFVLKEADYIEGIVLDAITQKPIIDATLFTSLSTVTASTDTEGRFKLQGIPLDSPLGYVTASKRGYTQETRKNVTIYDGELRFLLDPSASLTVRATTESGGAVPNFRVRLLRPNDRNGQFTDVAVEQLVSDDSGQTVINELEKSRYRAEVSGVGSTEGRTGALDFDFDPSATARNITVELIGGLVVSGRVVDATTEAPVPNAKVRMLNPPASAIPAGTPPFMAFLDRTTAGDGSFTFEEIAAGTYDLQATAGQLSSDIVKAVSAKPGAGGVTIPVMPSPRVYGTVTSSNGEPVRAATLYFTRNGGPPEGEPLVTDGGNYERYLPAAGTWTIICAENGTQNNAQQVVTLASGQSQEVNFDFSGRIKLTGTITINGSPADSSNVVMLRSDTGDQTLLVPGEVPGQYQAEVFPGNHEVSFMVDSINSPIGQNISLIAGEAEQRQDFAVQVGTMDVAIATGESGFMGGELTILRQAGGGEVVILGNWHVEQPSARFAKLPVGNYRVTLSQNGEVVGSSDVHPIPPGGTETFVIDLEPLAGS